ncbi:efflux transporter outer membrane subunit [Flavobacteriaceae bacterium TK19130]|nr:efflux transporter outer membrane subunit [Thermobacterium salinum]
MVGCTPKISEVSPPIEEADPFSSTTGEVTLEDKWWTAFNDPQLNTLIDSALQQNLNVLTTWEQVKEAKAIRRTQASFLWPDLSAQARTAISRPEPDFAGGENVQAGLAAAYEVDLWGRLSANKQAAAYRFQASYQDYQAAALSLSAEIATTWFQLLTAKEQLELAEQQINTNKDIIKLIRARFGSGQIRGVDILRQNQLLEATRDLKVVYETDVALLKNELAVLLGKPPQNFINPEVADKLPILPPKPSTGLPLELVRRRPDVQSAYSQLLAADRDMAAAVRAKYPRISLDLSVQSRSNTYDGLFKDWAYTLAGNIVAPLLYGGRLRAQVERTEAIKNQQLYQYGQTVLTAFREVEDALIQEEKQKERIAILEKRLDMADKTNRQLRIEFINGLSNYLDVLLALDEAQQLRRDMLVAKQQQLEIRISLYRALAGAFDTDREEELSE